MDIDLIRIDKEKFNEMLEVSQKELFSYRSNSLKSNIKKKINSLTKKKIWKEDLFFWPQALLAISLEATHKNTFSEDSLEALIKYYDSWIAKGLPINNLDNAMNGYSLLYVYEQTGNSKYIEAAKEIAEYLIKHPVDKKGTLPYRGSNNNKIFVDSLGMICPFLCRFGRLTNDIRFIELAILQLVNFLEYGMDDVTGLPYHVYSYEDSIKYGIIGWGRAVGWLMIGLVDSLEYIDNKNMNFDLLKESYIKLVDNVLKYSTSKGYYSWQLSTVDGPIDTSTTSMITYSLIKGAKLNFIEFSDYKLYIEASVKALALSTRDGKVFDCSTECLGIGMYPQKYGFYPWAQGPTTALLSYLISS